MDGENDITKLPFAGYLEEAIHDLAEIKPESIAILATLPSGEVYASWYNASAFDKALYAHMMQTQAMRDELEANSDWLRQVVDGELDEEEEERE